MKIEIGFIRYDFIESEKYKIIFKKPIKIMVWRKNGLYKIRYRRLNIRIVDVSYDFAVNSFESKVEFLYEDYGLAKDEDLTRGAIELKNKINFMISEVIHNEV